MMLRGMKGISYSWDWVCMSDLVMVGGIFDHHGQKKVVTQSFINL